MKIRITGNRELLRWVRLARDCAGVLRLDLTTTERGASFYLGTNGSDNTGRHMEGPCIIIAPPDEMDGPGCTILVEGEAPQEVEELRSVYPHTSQSKEDIFVAYLPMLACDATALDAWDPAD
jgi:hypothetical protein